MNSKDNTEQDPQPSTSKFSETTRRKRKNSQPTTSITFTETTELQNPEPSTSHFILRAKRGTKNWPKTSKATSSVTTEQSTSKFTFSEKHSKNNEPSTSKVTSSETAEQENLPCTSAFTYSGIRQMNSPPGTPQVTSSETTEPAYLQRTTPKFTYSGKRKKNCQPGTPSCTSCETTEQVNLQSTTQTFTSSGKRQMNSRTGAAKVTSCETTEEENTQPSTSHNLFPGSLCWSKLDGYPWWPAMFIGVKDLGCIDLDPDHPWVYWLGEDRMSMVKVDKICPFAENFKYKWSKNNRGKVYKKAIWECCKLQGRVMHHIIDNWDEETCLQWAMDGFEPRRLHGERRCDGLRGVPPSIKEVIDRTNEREREAKAKKLKKSNIKSKFGASIHSLFEESMKSNIRSKFGASTHSLHEKSTKSNIKSKFGASTHSLHEMTRPCLVGLERCDARMAQPKEVKMLSFNDNLSPALLTKLNFKVIYNVIINPDVDSLPEKAKLLQLGPIDFFIGGASRDGKQGDSLNRHLFECYRIITVLSEGNSELQWIFYAPLDASQEFIETANRFFVCKGEMLKTRITREQYLLWSNMSSLKEMTTEVIL